MINWIKTHLGDTLFLNTYLLVIIRALGAGFGFIFWVLAARTMSVDNVGLASGIVSAAMLLAGLAQLGLGYGLVRHLTHADDPNGLLNLSIVISSLTGFCLALLFLAGLKIWSPVLLPLRANLLTTLLFVILVLSTVLSQLLNWAFLATCRLNFSVFKQIIQALLAIVLLFSLSKAIPGYIAAITAYAIATIISCSVAFIFLVKAQPGYRFNLNFNFSLRSSFARFSLTNHFADQVQRAPDTLLPLIVIHQFGPGIGAYFFVAWAMGRSVTTWSNAVAESLFAEGSTQPNSAATHAWRAVKFGLLLTSGLALAMIIGGQPILSLYGQDYATHGVLQLYYVALTAIPGVLLSIFINFLRIRDHLKAISIIMMLGVGGGILLSYMGMLWLGFAGAGIGWLLSQILVLGCVGGWWQWHKSCQRKIIYPTQPIVEHIS